jgi:hypothetical protein
MTMNAPLELTPVPMAVKIHLVRMPVVVGQAMLWALMVEYAMVTKK